MTSPLRILGSIAGSGLFALSAAVAMPSAAFADVLVRAQGRCKLVSGGFESFNGHCTFKHKQAGSGTDAYVVKLDDGTDFVFRGPNPDALSVQTYRGITNVKHNAQADHEVFVWNDGEKRRLSVRLDQVQNSNAKFEDDNDTATAAAIVGGTAAAALIGALIAGNSQTQNAVSESTSVGAPVGELQSLVGAKGGMAERTIVSKGYLYRGGSTGLSSKFSFWEQPRTGNCVGVQTSDGRYQKIVYTDRSNCN